MSLNVELCFDCENRIEQMIRYLQSALECKTWEDVNRLIVTPCAQRFGAFQDQQQQQQCEKESIDRKCESIFNS